MIIKRIQSSIRENAQRFIDPKAMGVKTRRKIRMNFMR